MKAGPMQEVKRSLIDYLNPQIEPTDADRRVCLCSYLRSHTAAGRGLDPVFGKENFKMRQHRPI